MIRREAWADRRPVEFTEPVRSSRIGATEAMALVAAGVLIGWLAAEAAPAVRRMADRLPETLPPVPAWLLWACGIALAVLYVAYQVALLMEAAEDLERLQD